jgi:hypothetical protein
MAARTYAVRGTVVSDADEPPSVDEDWRRGAPWPLSHRQLIIKQAPDSQRCRAVRLTTRSRAEVAIQDHVLWCQPIAHKQPPAMDEGHPILLPRLLGPMVRCQLQHDLSGLRVAHVAGEHADVGHPWTARSSCARAARDAVVQGKQREPVQPDASRVLAGAASSGLAIPNPEHGVERDVAGVAVRHGERAIPDCRSNQEVANIDGRGVEDGEGGGRVR